MDTRPGCWCLVKSEDGVASVYGGVSRYLMHHTIGFSILEAEATWLTGVQLRLCQDLGLVDGLLRTPRSPFTPGYILEGGT